MPHVSEVRATDHDRHDLMLVAALAAGDLAGTERDQAIALTASCAECAALHDDLVAIARATATVPPPIRGAGRDFRLTPEQAASLRPSGWRRFVPAGGSRRLHPAARRGPGDLRDRRAPDRQRLHRPSRCGSSAVRADRRRPAAAASTTAGARRGGRRRAEHRTCSRRCPAASAAASAAAAAAPVAGRPPERGFGARRRRPEPASAAARRATARRRLAGGVVGIAAAPTAGSSDGKTRDHRPGRRAARAGPRPRRS